MIDYPKSTHRLVKELFLEAMEIDDADEAQRFLDERCGKELWLKTEVNRLLEAHQATDPVLDHADKVAPTIDFAEPLVAGQRVGQYEVVRLIGEGGMGLVYKAEQLQPLRRTVALKIIKPGLDTREVLRRFRLEQEVLGRLEHPHIARVIDAGQTEAGNPFFVMELVQGTAIDTFCDREQLSVEQRLRLFQVVCSAVGYAHRRGILHRDLKPKNILVARIGEEISPKVIDFGLAKAFDDSSNTSKTMTRHGHVVGTPRYMSPEQADSQTRDIDTRADVYSLGVLLHVLLSGLPPAGRDSSESAHSSVRPPSSSRTEIPPSRVLRSEPPDRQAKIAMHRASSPKDLVHTLSGDLDWIVMKCLEPDRERRYESVASLAQDISRYLGNEPIEARPPSTWYQLNRFVKRNRSAVAVASTLFVAMLLVSVVSIWQAGLARRAESRKDQALRDASASQRRSEALLYAADLRLADQALSEGDTGEAIRFIDRHRPEPGSGKWDHRGIEWELLHRRATQTRKVLVTDTQWQVDVVQSPSGERFAVVSDVGKVLLYDASQTARIGEFETEFGEATSAVWAPDSTTLAVGSAGGEIEIWNTSGPTLERTIHFGTERIWDLQYARDGTRLIASGSTPEVRVFDVATGQQVATLLGHERSVESLALSADGQLLACASNDHTSTVWDWQRSKIVTRSPEAPWRLTSVAITPDGRTLIDGAVKGEVRLMSAESGKVLRRAHFAAAVQALSVGPDGDHLAVGTRDGIIQLLPIGTGPNSKKKTVAKVPASLAAHERRVNSLAWIDRERVASVGRDGTCVISTTRSSDANSVSGSLRSIRIAVSDDGRWIVAHDFYRLQLIDTREGTFRDLVDFTTETNFAGVTFTPGSDELLVATSDDKLLITPTEHLDADHQRSLEVTDDFSDLRFSKDGRRLLMHSRSDRVLAVVEYPSMREIFRKPCPDSYTAAISSDGRLLAMSFQGDVYVHELDSRELIAESKDHHYETINDLHFGPQGRWIATISDDRTVRLWNFRSSEPPAILGAHPNGVPKGLVISADGRTLITHSRSGEVWAWSVLARQKLFPICRSDSGYKEFALSADDSTLVTVDGEGRIAWYTFTDRNSEAKK